MDKVYVVFPDVLLEGEAAALRSDVSRWRGHCHYADGWLCFLKSRWAIAEVLGVAIIEVSGCVSHYFIGVVAFASDHELVPTGNLFGVHQFIYTLK